MASLPPSEAQAGKKVANYHAPPTLFPSPADSEGTHVHVLRCLTSTIHLGFHLFPHIVHTLLLEEASPTANGKSSAFVLVADRNIASLFLDAFVAEFNSALDAGWPSSSAESSINDAISTSTHHIRPRLLTYIVPPGEGSKSRETKADLEDWMLSQKLTRDATVIALGGGVIGDLAGFVAATFMRGIKFIQIPTTLLAMVDSSVGGKTAIDTPAGKNLIGAFHQPCFIFIDAALLATLPEREFSNGMAEVIKTAAIWDADDFDKLELNAAQIRNAVMDRPAAGSEGPVQAQGRTLATRTQAQSLLLDVIRGSVGIKAHIVTIDEKETGLRNLVNFGHSIGHAIEAILTPDLLHGECVSIGMVLEAEIARAMPHGLPQVVIGRLTRCLKEYNLPISMEDPRILRITSTQRQEKQLSVERLLDIMRVDKKNSGAQKKIVLLSKVGGTVEERASTVPDSIIRRVLAPSVRVVPIPPQLGGASQQAAPVKTVKLSTPGSKSLSNRALVLAALARGTTTLRNLLHSDDTRVMMAALSDLDAARFEWRDGGRTVVVHGKGGHMVQPKNGKELYLQNAGTAARFMTSVCALVPCSTSAAEQPVVITGNKRMKERPVGPLVDALMSNGVSIQYREKVGCLPLAISSSQNGGLRGGLIQLAASISSQYVSSILLCAPYATHEEVVLELVGGQVISQLYIDMTVAMMRSFGIQVERLAENKYRIPRGHYVAPSAAEGGVYEIESDASSATYPLALAAITGTECLLEGIGSSSLQGDARFAKEVLEPMGCEVVQTANSTRVRGPPRGQLRQIGTVDMEPMTDAFLTASALLAVAGLPVNSSGGETLLSTRITGIANQRVKECNRIQAMMDELHKFGVRTIEHEDGLEIFGVADFEKNLKRDVQVHTYDDHRVAMAFSVLAAVAPGKGTILEEKRCVEKTWPDWWDALAREMGVSVEGVELDAAHTSAASASSSALAALPPLNTLSNHLTPRAYPPGATIFCIGMRGTGKTYLGKFASEALRRPFLDADAIFDERHTLNNFVKTHGWPSFRKIEREILEELIRDKSTNHLISLGGGVVETPENRALLREYAQTRGPVVYIKRDIEEIVAFLRTSGRPPYGESERDVWARRQPWFYECSSCELVNYTIGDVKQATSGSEAASEIASHVPENIVSIRNARTLIDEVRRFSRFITGVDSNRPSANILASKETHMLCLTFPDIRAALPMLEEISVGANVIELRVDLLNPAGIAYTTPAIPPAEYVSCQLAALRSRTTLPIIYTVRTQSQGGMFPDAEEEAYFELIKFGFRAACEYVDVEARWSEQKIAACVVAKGHSHIIASWHDWSGNLRWGDKSTLDKYAELCKFGDVTKIVSKACTLADNLELETFRRTITAQADAKPLIAINMGAVGQMSRILNPVFTPITHPALPFKAAPGQLSFAQIANARTLLGQLEPKRFFLLGTPISHSLSPTLHNTGFAITGLPHTYGLHETSKVDESVRDVIRSADFGGASVTIPHKLAIIPELDSITPHAKMIGAVNTIIPVRSGEHAGASAHLVGDNTDWAAIHAQTVRHLATSSVGEAEGEVDADGLTALVIGAGGSARAAIYAMQQLGARRIWLFNRTPANAVLLAQSLPSEWNVEVAESLVGLQPLPRIIVSNVPADGTTIEQGGAAIFLAREMLAHRKGGVVIDMSYKPSHTPLMELVRRENAKRSSGAASSGQWTGIPGLVILLEQGCTQFELWTGLSAPQVPVMMQSIRSTHGNGTRRVTIQHLQTRLWGARLPLLYSRKWKPKEEENGYPMNRLML
ncbi:putative ARO1-Pentafunctional AROM polypeptide [Tilletiaria anomala UBC 951]|uniref:Pentafunctional AROM polypeptide n=1 Tax=Tilletiaria anomala (strain ATCC 24038 / CBS 436.72 / UBC 951) TaxID=1037660 RepID=A0A066WEQ3_TILAU|nr:putative ARO1-Pentafunctional AROM polypeptide [Tilletiaria anomala UBC 951]KDN52407.1 putative ARO1-Pentafunctional AROM polypeptide [Tilletiaria anomala UBC 951]